MKKIGISVVFWVATLSSALAASAAPQLLPTRFAGWQQDGKAVSSRDPARADAAFAPLLKEYGFSDFEASTYSRPGRTAKVKAARFADASGAYGAFTFYKQPEMLTAPIGDEGASANERVLFYRGNVLVDIVLDRVTAMSAAELRELADSLPLAPSSARNLPSVQNYLPKQAAVANSTKYVMGPIALRDVSAPISSELVDFTAGAEVALGQYSSSGGPARLMIISYPTPQIAGQHLRQIEAFAQANPAPQAQLQVKRTGPMVAVVSGPISASDAKSLLASVNYEADVTWNENTFFTKRDNLANLLVGIIILVAILIGFALVAGLLFGGFRILMKRMFPDSVFDRSKEAEIISLRLNERRGTDLSH
jgi:hypothetical protein